MGGKLEEWVFKNDDVLTRLNGEPVHKYSFAGLRTIVLHNDRSIGDSSEPKESIILRIAPEEADAYTCGTCIIGNDMYWKSAFYLSVVYWKK